MNEASKVEAILDAWLEFIALEDFSNATVPGNQAVLRGVELVGDYVRIDEVTFSDLQQALEQERGQQETTWVLSFPRISTGNRGQSESCPLFSLDVTSILKGEYREEGWNLNDLKLTEAGERLATFLKLEDDEREQLITRDGLEQFLRTTFKQDFKTYEEWMKRVNIPLPRSYQVQPQPYLFKFQGSGFSWNLKPDLKDIKLRPSNRLKPGHPAREYLFGAPQPPEHKVTYMGAYPTDPPTDSQLRVLKHAQSQPLTAVQGPPGSGKTTLILHLIAQQVVKRAINLIEEGKDINNNLVVVSSTVNKAVDNVVDKLDKSLRGEFFYLKGGNQENINSAGGAREQLQEALDFLQNSSFDENYQSSLVEEIRRLKQELKAEENHYIDLREQRDFDEARLTQLLERLQTLKQERDALVTDRVHIEERATELAEYEQLPIKAYEKIQSRLNLAQSILADLVLSWLAFIWRGLARRIDKVILLAIKSTCKSEIQETLDTPFGVEFPTSRSALARERQLIREQLVSAQELQSLPYRLQENSEALSSVEQERHQVSGELNSLERKLETQLEDFYAFFHTRYHEQHKELFRLSREFLRQEAFRCKDRVTPTLELYSNVLSRDRRARNQIANNLDEHLKALSLMFPVITCTLLSVRNMLPWVEECVEQSIVDEAGMIPLHQTFPLLVRSRQAIIVGDPLQIEPIIKPVKETLQQYHQEAFLGRGLTENDIHRYSPDEVECATTYHRAAGASGEDNDKGQGILLREHFRCQPNIISFCDRIAGYRLEVKTTPTPSRLESNLIAYHVEGNIRNDVNEEEVTAIRELVQHLVKQGYLLKDIGVISAFRKQANALKDCLLKQFPGLPKDSIGTIHNFQGSQKKVIILSTKVCRTQDNYRWINKRLNLLNVAVSRAEELFILIGNLYRLEKAGSYTRQLVEHIREYGDIIEYKPEIENPYQSSSSSLVFDCEHLDYFSRAIQEVEQELIIVTPWLRGDEPKKFADSIISAIERGVNVTVIYGYLSHEDGNDANNDDNDTEAEKKLKDVLGSRLLRSHNGGTNQRILFWDNKFAVVGSWNWLSHQYRDFCNKSLVNPAVQIRRETSVFLSDSSNVASLKEDIDGFVQQQF